MGKVIQISIIGRIYGNVNADEVVGQRITIKKMYSSSGEVFPFVSARAVKRAIRDALFRMGYKVDQFRKEQERALGLADTGRPDLLIDNDLFGYMLTGKQTYNRQGPVAMSYFKAIKDTPITSEFGARFPRDEDPSLNPVPFEVEVADFIGKLNVVIYDYIGDFTAPNENPDIETKKLSLDERKKRLRDFLEVLLLPKYVLPRRTNSLNIPEYIGALISTSNVGPIPIYGYHTYDFENNLVCGRSLSKLLSFKEMYGDKIELYYIDYKDAFPNTSELTFIRRVTLNELLDILPDFLFTE